VLPNEYSINYVEENLIANQKYKIQLKKYSKEIDSSFLIICISSPEEFYLAKNNFEKIDSSNWSEIYINFVIPEKISKNVMSIFFQNTGKEIIYLDDFKITKTY